jgi:hypothetical protein
VPQRQALEMPALEDSGHGMNLSKSSTSATPVISLQRRSIARL